MSGAFDKELRAMDSAWANAPEGFADLPEGIYTMQISEASIKKTKTSGKPRATFRFVVTEGEHLGSSQMDGFMLDPENPVGMSILKTLLGKKLGYEIPDSLSEVEDILADISKKNPIVTAQVVKKGDFTNVKVLEMVDAGGGESPPEDTTDNAAADGGDDGYKVGDKVKFKNEDEMVLGTITKKSKSGDFSIETDDAVWDDIPADLLSLQDDEAADPEMEALVGFCGAQGVAIDSDASKEGIIKILSKMRWASEELTSHERELLTTNGIKLVTAPAPKATPKSAPKATPKAKPKACKACGGSGKNSKGKPCPICSAK